MDHINWEKLVQAEFQYQGTTCRIHAPRKCTQNLFCVTCQEGGLCAAEFQISEQGRHLQHSKLQVRRNSRMYSLLEKDLRKYLDTSAIQKYVCNEAVQVYLRTRELNGKSKLAPDEKPSATCQGCLSPISMPRTAAGGSDKGSVCSVQCLLLKLANSNFEAKPVQLADHDHLGSCSGHEPGQESDHAKSSAASSAGGACVVQAEVSLALVPTPIFAVKPQWLNKLAGFGPVACNQRNFQSSHNVDILANVGGSQFEIYAAPNQDEIPAQSNVDDQWYNLNVLAEVAASQRLACSAGKALCDCRPKRVRC